MRKFMALAAAVMAVAITAGIAHADEAKAACTFYCNQYVRPYYKPSTGTWVQGYWRNDPSDSIRVTPYYSYSWRPTTYNWRPTTVFRSSGFYCWSWMVAGPARKGGVGSRMALHDLAHVLAHSGPGIAKVPASRSI
jgi:hypothetical protein